MAATRSRRRGAPGPRCDQSNSRSFPNMSISLSKSEYLPRCVCASTPADWMERTQTRPGSRPLLSVQGPRPGDGAMPTGDRRPGRSQTATGVLIPRRSERTSTMVPGMTERERLITDMQRLEWLCDAVIGPARSSGRRPPRIGSPAEAPWVPHPYRGDETRNHEAQRTWFRGRLRTGKRQEEEA